MEFTYKAAEVLLAPISEVLKHRFRVVCFTGLPHHGSQPEDVRAQRGHGSHMAVRFEVEDLPIPIDVLLAQDAGQNLSLHVAGRRHRLLEQANQCTSLDAGTGCWNRPISAFLTSVLCSLIARSAGHRLTSGRFNRIIQKRIEGGWAYLQPAWPFRRHLQMQLDTIQLPWRARGRLCLAGACAQYRAQQAFQIPATYPFYFGVADSVKANQPGNKIFLHGRTMAPVL
jgi:hypothetical protein